jgi:hypothetical protein
LHLWPGLSCRNSPFWCGGALPRGLILFGILALPVMIGARIGAWLRRCVEVR